MFDDRIRAFIFDIGATLITGPSVAPNKVISAMIAELTEQEVSSIIMTNPINSASVVCEMIREKSDCITGDIESEIYKLYSEQENAPKEIDGASELVSNIKELGYKIGLLSDIWTPYYKGVCKAIPKIIDIVDAIILSYETGYRKPEKENFYRILNELKVRPQEAVMVGDTYTHDILPAIELGMHTIWILSRPEKEADYVVQVLNKKMPGPDLTILNIKDLKLLINN